MCPVFPRGLKIEGRMWSRLERKWEPEKGEETKGVWGVNLPVIGVCPCRKLKRVGPGWDVGDWWWDAMAPQTAVHASQLGNFMCLEKVARDLLFWQWPKHHTNA